MPTNMIIMIIPRPGHGRPRGEVRVGELVELEHKLGLRHSSSGNRTSNSNISSVIISLSLYIYIYIGIRMYV